MQWFKDLLELLAPGWVGSIIGLVGIGAAAVTYFLTRQRTLLAYRYTGERLLGLSADGLPSDITVQYRGENIPRLTRSLVVFWNAGEKTLLSDDIVQSDPLRLVIQDGRVLSATVLKRSRDVNQVEAVIDPNVTTEVVLRFAFLDSSDGAVVEILHTSENRHADFVGTVRGLPKGIQDLGRIAGRRFIQRAFPLVISPRKLGWLGSGMGIVIALVGLLWPDTNLDEAANINLHRGLILAGVGAFYTLLGITLIILTRRRYPKELHVDELG